MDVILWNSFSVLYFYSFIILVFRIFFMLLDDLDLKFHKKFNILIFLFYSNWLFIAMFEICYFRH